MKKTLLIASHMDTVNANREKEKWPSNPFKARVIKNYIEGRGAVDMKSSIAAAICSLHILEKKAVPGNDIGNYCEKLTKEMIDIKSLSKNEARMGEYIRKALKRLGMSVEKDDNGNVIGTMPLRHYGGKVIFAGTVREELAKDSDREHGLPFILQSIELPSATVITEPTDMRPAIRHPGRVVAHFTFHGRKGGPCHTGDMKPGDNAILNSIPYLSGLTNTFSGKFNLTHLDSDSKDENKVPSLFKVSFDKRFHGDINKIIAKIENIELKGQKPDIEYIGRRRSFEGDPNSDIAKAFHFRAPKGKFLTMNYSTDATYTQNHKPPIPTIVIGVGDPKLAHKPCERVLLEDLRAAPEIYAKGFTTYFSN